MCVDPLPAVQPATPGDLSEGQGQGPRGPQFISAAHQGHAGADYRSHEEGEEDAHGGLGAWEGRGPGGG